MNLKELLFNGMLRQMLSLCRKELEVDSLPEITLVGPEELGGQSFGMFDPTNNRILVVAENRHPMDTMRTIAHELVHWKQKSSGHHLDGSDGSESENQANSIAGIIMRKFARMYPEYFWSGTY